MRYAISIPQQLGEHGFDRDAFRAHLARAEELGFHSAWTQEAVFAASPTLSPLEAMTYAAACTERIRLGCAVFVSPLHSPVHLARSIASLDCLSGGRLEVGFGAGGPGRQFGAFGVDPSTFVARFGEGLALMMACWTEPEISFDGRFWRIEGARMEPKPVQRPHPPIWIGASHPNAVRRAVRLGDGFFGAGSQTTAQFAEQVAIVREELERQERDPGSFQVAKRVYVHVDDDAERARSLVDAALARHYGRGGLAAVAVTGPPDACVEGLRAVADSGAELIQLGTLADDREQIERLAAEVLPNL